MTSPRRRLRSLRRVRGVMLFEVLIAVMLMGVFGTLSVEVIRSTLRVSRDASEASALSARFDGALAQLRRDVWGAAKTSTPDATTLRIERADAKPITWTVTKEGAFVRTTDSGHQDWSEISAGLTFELTAAGVSVNEPASVNRDARQIPLVSQLAVASAGAGTGRGAP